MSKLLRRFWKEEEGQTLVEYALIITLVAIAVIGLLTFLGKRVSNTYSYTGGQLPNGS